MSYRRRIYFTSEQKSEIWDRWQSGESMRSIGRGFDRNSSSIYPLLSRTGGIRPSRSQAVKTGALDLLSVKRYPEDWKAVYRCVVLPGSCNVLPRPSVVKSNAMAALINIELSGLIKRPGNVPIVPNRASWPATGL